MKYNYFFFFFLYCPPNQATEPIGTRNDLNDVVWTKKMPFCGLIDENNVQGNIPSPKLSKSV